MGKTMIIAHRGYSSIAPENTMAAFLQAINGNFHGIEFDVQLSKDNVPVIIHDETLDRTSNGTGYVKDYTLAKLRTFDFGSYFDEKFQNERIPTLEEYLEKIKNWSGISNIELKNDNVDYHGMEKIVIELVQKYNCIDNIIISSMNHESLKIVKEICTEVRIGILYDRAVKPLSYVKELNGYSVHPYYKDLTKEFVEEHKKENIKIFPYTINMKEDMERAIEYGVTGMFTDYPDLLKECVDLFNT